MGIDQALERALTPEEKAHLIGLATAGNGNNPGQLVTTKENSAAHAVLVKLSDVQPKPVRWLWQGRMPLGKVSILDGDPGFGKSLISIDIAARVSKGREMPNAAIPDLKSPAGVVFLSAEDDPQDTIRPRLDVAGADLTRIVLLCSVRKETELCLPSVADLEAIREAVKAANAALVVIDPLMAYLPTEVNSHIDQDIRRSLAPVASLAAELEIAVLVIRHLNKASGGNPLYRGGGSIGIIGAARSGLLATKDPDDEAKYILSVTKSNLARLSPSLSYSIEETYAEVPYLLWHGTTEHTAASLLADQAANQDDRSALQEAIDFLQEVLAEQPKPANEILKQARKDGIAEKTLRRAKGKLKIWTKPKEYQGERYWGLPSHSWPVLAKTPSLGHPESMTETDQVGRD
jgi:RecA-family ATPase